MFSIQKTMKRDPKDPHNLNARFIDNQQVFFSQALGEMRQGKKRGHWLWFILPTDPYMVNGQEVGSEMNRFYALRKDAPVAYLKTEVLRNNYVQICKAIEGQLQYGNRMEHLFGSMDRSKVLSSWKLFHATAKKLGDDELANLCQNLLQLGAFDLKEEKSRGINGFFAL